MAQKVTSETSPAAENDQDEGDDLAFVCVHCGTPCSTLYRQLSASLSSIKATDCSNPQCRQVVDPYIEREWLLVAIDCILLRPEAYRHVLFNAKEHFETVTLRRAFQLTVATSILHGYLKFETIKTALLLHQRQQEGSDEQLHQPPTNIGLLVLTSVSDLMVQWAAIYFFLKHQISQSRPKKNSHRHLPAKIFWSLILPTAFQVVSIFVLIWENSKTTRALGSLLVTCWQGLAISLVADNVVPNSGKAAAMVGIVAVMLWRLAVNQLFHQEACVGFEIDFIFSRSNDNKPFLPVCLT